MQKVGMLLHTTCMNMAITHSPGSSTDDCCWLLPTLVCFKAIAFMALMSWGVATCFLWIKRLWLVTVSLTMKGPSRISTKLSSIATTFESSTLPYNKAA